MTKIYYDNNDLFSGIAPTPYVSKQDSMIQYGSRWGVGTALSLIGNITGQCEDFEFFIQKQEELSSRLLYDYKSLVIQQDNNNIYSGEYAIINSINYGESLYVGLVPFQIDITVYDSELFSGQYGILDPSDFFSYKQNDDGTTSLSHTISARGFNTETQALINARNWVLGRTGLDYKIEPFFNTNCYNNTYCLQSRGETINPWTAEYSVSEEYLRSDKNQNGYLLNYTSSIDTDIDSGITAITVAGTMQGCYDDGIEELREKMDDVDLYHLVLVAYNKARGGTTEDLVVNNYPLSETFNESENDNKIDFSVVYDDNPSPLVICDYEVSLDYDELSEVTRVAISATIRSRGPKSERLDNVTEYFNTKFDPFHLANKQYKQSTEVPNSYLLNKLPITESLSTNHFEGEISYSAQWTNKKAFPEPFKDLSYNINITPTIRQYAPYKILDQNGRHVVLDLGWANRSSITIGGQGFMKYGSTFEEGRNTIVSILNKLVRDFGGRDFLNSQDITEINPGEISFNASWTYYDEELLD